VLAFCPAEWEDAAGFSILDVEGDLCRSVSMFLLVGIRMSTDGVVFVPISVWGRPSIS
jgi:hypothetical protein